MTNRGKIKALKKVQVYRKEISDLLEQIIKDTYDYHCKSIHNFSIYGNSISVDYALTCCGEDSLECCIIPIEWLDEGFDYKATYEEMRRQAELARLRAVKEEVKRLEKIRKNRAKIRKEQEYKKYLALKKKYEGGSKQLPTPKHKTDR